MNAQGWLLDRQEGLRTLDRRRPWLLDSAVAVLMLLFTLPSLVVADQRNPGVFVAVLALLLPVWWRRSAPVVAFAATIIVLLVEWSLDVWIGTGVVLLVMLYGVAARSSLRALAWASAATVTLLLVGVFVLTRATEQRLAAFLLLVGTTAGAAAAGLAVRTRRAYLVALEDRAARLEIERDQQSRLAVADERARVAREMHDIVGHHVSVIVGLADGGAALAASRGERAEEPLRLIGETGRQALAELRRVLGVLREEDAGPQLSPQPGIDDLDRLLPSVRAAGLAVTYRTSGDLHTLGRGVQLAVYRIVQEALTNTLKHAGRGAAADVTVAASDGEVRVRVWDNGVSAADTPGAHHGLVGMRERASLYGGKVIAGPAEVGWLVDVVLREPS